MKDPKSSAYAEKKEINVGVLEQRPLKKKWSLWKFLISFDLTFLFQPKCLKPFYEFVVFLNTNQN